VRQVVDEKFDDLAHRPQRLPTATFLVASADRVIDCLDHAVDGETMRAGAIQSHALVELCQPEENIEALQ